MTHLVSVPKIPAGPVVPVIDSLHLQTTGMDQFAACSLPKVQRVYGGQLIAQGLLAASATLEDHSRLPHSLHVYFLRGADPETELSFNVERVRDGKSFSNRQVVCYQADKEILSLSASFQKPQGTERFGLQPPQVPAPTEVRSDLRVLDNMNHPLTKFMGPTVPFDIRHVQGAVYDKPDPERRSHQQVWMRPLAHFPSDVPQTFQRAFIAFMIDQLMLEPAVRERGLTWSTPGVALASLDHAMWFHADVDVNDWLLFDGSVSAIGGERAQGEVNVFDSSSRLVASAAQEAMLRINDNNDKGTGHWGFQ